MSYYNYKNKPNRKIHYNQKRGQSSENWFWDNFILIYLLIGIGIAVIGGLIFVPEISSMRIAAHVVCMSVCFYIGVILFKNF